MKNWFLLFVLTFWGGCEHHRNPTSNSTNLRDPSPNEIRQVEPALQILFRQRGTLDLSVLTSDSARADFEEDLKKRSYPKPLSIMCENTKSADYQLDEKGKLSYGRRDRTVFPIFISVDGTPTSGESFSFKQNYNHFEYFPRKDTLVYLGGEVD